MGAGKKLSNNYTEYTCEEGTKAKKKTSHCVQFTDDEAGTYYPCRKTVDNLPSGYYNLCRDNHDNIFFKAVEPKLDKLVVLETSPTENKIIEDMHKFWENKELYRKRGKVYKRNILLYSKPGVGKTSLINILISDLMKSQENVVVIMLNTVNEINLFRSAMNLLRDIMPDKPIVTVMEDIDNFAGAHAYSREIETEILNILDGNYKFDNMVVIATTNYPEYLTERYICRPSRFNRRFELPLPSADTRREFLEKTNLPEDLEKINLDEWVERTEGYTIDFLKELSDSVFISQRSEDSVFAELNEMMGIKVVKTTGGKTMGLA